MTLLGTVAPADVDDFLEVYGRNELMIQPVNGEPIEILLVEDSPDDIVLTTEALKEGKVRNRVSVVEDGEEAMAFLRRQGSHAAAPRPDLVLLDLNLPRKS